MTTDFVSKSSLGCNVENLLTGGKREGQTREKIISTLPEFVGVEIMGIVRFCDIF